MKLAICSDHRGYGLKSQLVKKMAENGMKFEDFGCFSDERCDYPVFAFKVGEAVKNKECEMGVVICGSGDGVCISANKVKGIRCICAKDSSHVERARQHVNINVLALAAEETNVDQAFEMLQTFINTEFLGDRYQERIVLIDKYESENN
jgi:ribose 5-phosphate isomerase B